ncbi:UNVERIFIED_CONTAM: putative galactinol--sucrose galactosyltransferase 2 [Sesamum radiatum]|uniref:Galactinol--sucrose galactosyltransferase 2 n=1 Tax=Sesamum radiatum TaxID=300843 RepID=A0AAW2WGY3_SESRA
MTITAVPVIKNVCLMVRGKVVLTGVPGNVVISPASSGSAFVGASSTSSSSRHVFSLGVLDFKEGGISPKFLIIDDGWQETTNEFQKEGEPLIEGTHLLKIWNLNKLTGVVGVFNCQGAGTWPMKQAPECNENSKPAAVSISGRVSPHDVEFLEEIAGETWDGECAVYAFNTGSLSRVPKNKTIEVSLGVLQCEIYTVSPIKVFKENVDFAPIGLIKMYNSGGAIEDCTFGDSIRIKARGSGLFGAFSSKNQGAVR